MGHTDLQDGFPPAKEAKFVVYPEVNKDELTKGGENTICKGVWQFSVNTP